MLLVNFFNNKYYLITTIFNFKETVIFSKDKYRWGWVQKDENKYIYGYIERNNNHLINEKELIEELNIGDSRYVYICENNNISSDTIKKILKIPNKEDILTKYRCTKHIKSNEIKKLKKELEDKGNEVLIIKCIGNETIVYRTDKSDWKVISLDKNLNKLMDGIININMDILLYKVFENSVFRD